MLTQHTAPPTRPLSPAPPAQPWDQSWPPWVESVDKGPGTTNISCTGLYPPSGTPGSRGRVGGHTRKGLLGTLTPPQETMMVCLMGFMGT